MENFIEFFKKGEVIVACLTGLISALIAVITYRWNNKRHRANEKDEKTDLKNELTLSKGEVARLKSDKESLKEDKEQLQNKVEKLEASISSGSSKSVTNNEELIQLEKTVYVKYLYIIPDSLPHVYTKRIDRLNLDVPVRTESVHYKLNRYNKINDNVHIQDSTNQKHGVVDMAVIYPWGKLKGHRTQLETPTKISQNLKGSDTYITASTYINGFVKGQEDYAIMGEHLTKSARIVADFSTIPHLEKLFEKEPDGYRYFDENNQHQINNCIQKIRHGVYSLHVNNLELGEIIKFDFHINWEYLDDN